MSFLKAEWRKLALANYEVDPNILKPYLPAKTELDTWSDTHYVSLVGFMFVNTKMLGIRIPFHVNFEEVNLRFYVRYQDQNEWKRGVVFIKEIVPKPAITFVANTLYNEHYVTHKMGHLWEDKTDYKRVTYEWVTKGKLQSFSVETAVEAIPIEVGSEAEFITEHYWGYTKVNERKTFEYEVTHPRWDVYPVKKQEINVDYGLVYGDDFKFLNQLQPKSVMLAEGSEISVENKRTI
ncbi:MAG: DUF2071 domain-containing protein [Bacteroidota bacterium]